MGSVAQGTDRGLEEAVRIDEGKVRSHVDELVRSTVESTLNDLLDAEADAAARRFHATRSLPLHVFNHLALRIRQRKAYAHG